MHFCSGCDDTMQLTLGALDGSCLAAKSTTIFFIYFCSAEFDRSAHTGISENRKLLSDNKRTTPTPEVEQPVYMTMITLHIFSLANMVETLQSVLPCDNSLPIMGIDNLDTLAIELEFRRRNSCTIILYDVEEPSGSDKKETVIDKKKVINILQRIKKLDLESI